MKERRRKGMRGGEMEGGKEGGQGRGTRYLRPDTAN